MPIRPSTAHLALGDAFYDPVAPALFPALTLRYRNQRIAGTVGLDDLTDAQWIDHFGHFVPLPGSLGTPLALRYHGHQFGTYNPHLGDGRGFLYAQLHDLHDGRLLDLGTKGSGRTPWSRGGDGRLTLKGGVREVLAAGMLEALWVDTSKALSLIETGEELERHDEPSPTRASVLVRLSHGHIRIGTFQRLAYLGDTENLSRLLDHALATYYPGTAAPGDNDRAASFLAAVVRRVAITGADSIAAGFVHGVLNSDNIAITGESFDYGPWRFLPTYEPGFTAAYFDETGLYAFGRQPDALAFNLTRLAETLLPLGEHGRLEAALNSFWPTFQEAMWRASLRRLGLVSRGDDADSALLVAILAFLYETQMPYEQFWFDWRGGLMSASRAADGPAAAHYADARFAPVRAALADYAPAPHVRLDHPYFQRATPRTMRIAEMEALWTPIAENDDWSALGTALDEIALMREAYADDLRAPARGA